MLMASASSARSNSALSGNRCHDRLLTFRKRSQAGWRSSAAYRVRIGLNIKALAYVTHPVHLVRDGGEQHAPAYAQLNPQQLVPALRHGAVVVPQSLAILEYLEEAFPGSAQLLPAAPSERARCAHLPKPSHAMCTRSITYA